jgi:hypothetical protein
LSFFPTSESLSRTSWKTSTEMPGFKGNRKRGLTLTLYKKTFRYRLPVSPPRKRTKTSSSTPNLKSPSIRTPVHSLIDILCLIYSWLLVLSECLLTLDLCMCWNHVIL